MLSRRGSHSRWARGVAAAGGLLLVLSLFAVATPASAAPGDTDGSVIGGTGESRDDYFDHTNDVDPDVDIDAEPEEVDACVKVGGAVTLADLAQYDGPAPQGEGVWEYRLCGEDGDAARAIAREHPDVPSLKQYCAVRENVLPRAKCTVFIHWKPELPERRAVDPGGRRDFFDGYLRFTTDLRTSPAHDLPNGLIVNFPIWYWDQNNNFPKPIFLPVFGGITGIAFHLETTWETDGERICSSSGTIYRPGQHAPEQRSPTCHHSYPTMGNHQVRGCKQWLIIAQLGGLFPVPIVFPLTLCRNVTVPVKESQIVTGGDPRRAPVR